MDPERVRSEYPVVGRVAAVSIWVRGRGVLTATSGETGFFSPSPSTGPLNSKQVTKLVFTLKGAPGDRAGVLGSADCFSEPVMVSTNLKPRFVRLEKRGV